MRETIGLLALAALVLAGMMFCGGQLVTRAIPSQPGQTPTATPSARLVLSLSGSGDELAGVDQKTSQTFRVDQKEWYMDIACEALDPDLAMFFTATVFPEDEPITSLNFLGFAQRTSGGSDRHWFHGKGDFYVMVSAMNVESWSLKVCE